MFRHHHTLFKAFSSKMQKLENIPGSVQKHTVREPEPSFNLFCILPLYYATACFLPLFLCYTLLTNYEEFISSLVMRACSQHTHTAPHAQKSLYARGNNNGGSNKHPFPLLSLFFPSNIFLFIFSLCFQGKSCPSSTSSIVEVFFHPSSLFPFPYCVSGDAICTLF